MLSTPQLLYKAVVDCAVLGFDSKPIDITKIPTELREHATQLKERAEDPISAQVDIMSLVVEYARMVKTMDISGLPMNAFDGLSLDEIKHRLKQHVGPIPFIAQECEIAKQYDKAFCNFFTQHENDEFALYYLLHKARALNLVFPDDLNAHLILRYFQSQSPSLRNLRDLSPCVGSITHMQSVIAQSLSETAKQLVQMVNGKDLRELLATKEQDLNTQQAFNEHFSRLWDLSTASQRREIFNQMRKINTEWTYALINPDFKKIPVGDRENILSSMGNTLMLGDVPFLTQVYEKDRSDSVRYQAYRYLLLIPTTKESQAAAELLRQHIQYMPDAPESKKDTVKDALIESKKRKSCTHYKITKIVKSDAPPLYDQFTHYGENYIQTLAGAMPLRFWALIYGVIDQYVDENTTGMGELSREQALKTLEIMSKHNPNLAGIRYSINNFTSNNCINNILAYLDLIQKRGHWIGDESEVIEAILKLDHELLEQLELPNFVNLIDNYELYASYALRLSHDWHARYTLEDKWGPRLSLWMVKTWTQFAYNSDIDCFMIALLAQYSDEIKEYLQNTPPILQDELKQISAELENRKEQVEQHKLNSKSREKISELNSQIRLLLSKETRYEEILMRIHALEHNFKTLQEIDVVISHQNKSA